MGYGPSVTSRWVDISQKLFLTVNLMGLSHCQATISLLGLLRRFMLTSKFKNFIHRYASIQNQSEISPSETVHVVLGITSLSELLQDLVGGLVFIFSLLQWNLHISGCNLSLVPIRHFRVNLCLRYKVHISGQSLVKN